MKRTLASKLLYALIITTAFSCVPARQFEEVKTKSEKCEEDKARLKSENLELNTKLTEVEADFADLKKRWDGLKNDTAVMGTSLRRLTTNYDKLNATYERLLDQHSKMLQGKTEDHEKLMAQVQDMQSRLQEKEDALRKLELTLGDKEKNLDNLNTDLKKSQSELEAREKRVRELESAINRKDSVVKALKDKVADALLGFKNDGLTVEQRNGKVYVSMEERLLFASGSWNVDKRGAEALKKLGKVLETQPDINVMIEGHTDSVPFNGSSQVKDNWDLSVMRATAITKIITDNSKVDPKRLTAAGRSKYIPLDSNESKEGRAKNRRTEIILTPKLDELFKILETN